MALMRWDRTWTDNPLDEWDDFEREQMLLGGVCYGKGGGSAPAPPDPAQTAAAQGAANKEAVHESARVNQINEVGPAGTLTYTGTIGDPDRTRTVKLSESGQALYDQREQIGSTLGDYAQGRANQLPQDEFSFDQFGDLPAFDSDYRTSVQDDMFSRLNPQIDRRRTQVETQLANQGIVAGSEAWNASMDDLSREENDLRLAISGMAGDEMSRLYNLQLANRQQDLSEYQTERNAPINELAAALQGSPAIGAPSFSPQAQYQIGAPDIAGLTLGNYNAQVGAANAANAANGALTGNVLGAGGSIAAASIMASDRRLKTDVVRVGKLENGINVYSFRYKWGGPVQIGVMAQEVLKVIPKAVHQMGEYLAVDYSMLEAV